MIDWTKLQPYKTTKSKSFEQLCYQIVTRVHFQEGKLTSIDDSGGGDGVEFFRQEDEGELRSSFLTEKAFCKLRN